MAVAFLNYEYKYRKNGKPVFAPNARGRRIGQDIKRQVERAVQFDPFYYHLKAGGHVAALHGHRPHQYFARLDLEHYFYSISKSRVQRSLVASGILRARHYAKWSCVRNPYGDPRYSLPYGFVQSPILATLVFMTSVAGTFLRNAANNVTVSVYMDDISLSSANLTSLEDTFEAARMRLDEAGFTINEAKVREPGPAMDLFNCDLQQGRTVVQQARVAQFHAQQRSIRSEEAFERYCDGIKAGNV
jgi:hypothetical protein